MLPSPHESSRSQPTHPREPLSRDCRLEGPQRPRRSRQRLGNQRHPQDPHCRVHLYRHRPLLPRRRLAQALRQSNRAHRRVPLVHAVTRVREEEVGKETFFLVLKSVQSAYKYGRKRLFKAYKRGASQNC